ncbi:hypothetical protein [Micromonospora sp. NPDC047730]|uniref:hypothetical protein n=1 Tax=Micromonospora sp. NPDC047730 TaxID=3364253 RepID=UPI00371C295C
MYPNHPQYEAERQRAGFFRAGKVAAWVWVAVTVIPLVLILVCCGLCLAGGTLGAVIPAPSSEVTKEKK